MGITVEFTDGCTDVLTAGATMVLRTRAGTAIIDQRPRRKGCRSRCIPHQIDRDVMKTLLIALGLTVAAATLATPAHAYYLRDCLRGAPCPGFNAPSPRYYGPPRRYYGPPPAYYDYD